MKKASLLLVFLFVVSSIFGQDTIYVSKSYKSIVILPEDITDIIEGNSLGFVLERQEKTSENSKRIFKLSYNISGREEAAFTNLAIITESGDFYEFILAKTDTPRKRIYPIEKKSKLLSLNENEAQDKRVRVSSPKHPYGSGSQINTSNESIVDDEPEEASDDLYESDRREYYRSKCYYNQFDDPVLIRHYERTGDVFLRMGGIYYNKNELYFQVIIDNQEPIDYDVNLMRFAISTTYKKNSSSQSTELQPVFRYKVPKKIKGGTKNYFFVVFEKFTLDKNKTFTIELDEDKGNRNLTLTTSHLKVNKPIRF